MIPHPSDTIVALSSASGPGARAIVRLSGPKSREIVDRLFISASPLQPRHLQFGTLRLTGLHSPLPAEVYFFPGPRSYTGQDLAEFHTISSPPLVEELIAHVLNAGARAAQPGEFTLRAFLAGKKDLAQAEAVMAVIDAQSEPEFRRALEQLAGGMTQPLAAMRHDLLNLLADIEAVLDFGDEDIEFVSKPETLARLGAAIAALTNLRRQLDARTVSGRAVRIALVGEPNAGKSSLFNALLGKNAALVSPLAGTTRDYLSAATEFAGVPVELFDTAGEQSASDGIESQAQRLRAEQIERADVLLWCVPANLEVGAACRAALECRPAGGTYMIRTKSDLVESSEGIPVSIHRSNGLDALKRKLSEVLPALSGSCLAPSQSRCRHHVDAAIENLRAAMQHAAMNDPPELLAHTLKLALDQVGEMSGAVYTNDLLDRIFSRFCIGK